MIGSSQSIQENYLICSTHTSQTPTVWPTVQLSLGIICPSVSHKLITDISGGGTNPFPIAASTNVSCKYKKWYEVVCQEQKKLGCWTISCLNLRQLYYNRDVKTTMQYGTTGVQWLCSASAMEYKIMTIISADISDKNAIIRQNQQKILNPKYLVHLKLSKLQLSIFREHWW